MGLFESEGVSGEEAFEMGKEPGVVLGALPGPLCAGVIYVGGLVKAALWAWGEKDLGGGEKLGAFEHHLHNVGVVEVGSGLPRAGVEDENVQGGGFRGRRWWINFSIIA